jgi:hypothetical protein
MTLLKDIPVIMYKNERIILSTSDPRMSQLNLSVLSQVNFGTQLGLFHVLQANMKLYSRI